MPTGRSRRHYVFRHSGAYRGVRRRDAPPGQGRSGECPTDDQRRTRAPGRIGPGRLGPDPRRLRAQQDRRSRGGANDAISQGAWRSLRTGAERARTESDRMTVQATPVSTSSETAIRLQRLAAVRFQRTIDVGTTFFESNADAVA